MCRGRCAQAGQGHAVDEVSVLQGGGGEGRAGDRHGCAVGLALVVRRHRQGRRTYCEAQGCRGVGDGVIGRRKRAAGGGRGCDRIRAAGDVRRGRCAQAGQDRAAHRLAILQTRRIELGAGKGEGRAVGLALVVRRHPQRRRSDVGPRSSFAGRGPKRSKECKNTITEGAIKGDQLASANVLGIEIGVANGTQRYWRKCGRYVRFERADGCRWCAIVGLIEGIAEHPRFCVQGRAACQLRAVGQNFGVGRRVINRIEANAECSGKVSNGNAVGRTGNGHGATDNSSRPCAVVTGTQYHIARGNRHRRIDVYVVSGRESKVSSGGGDRLIYVDIVSGDQGKTSRGRGYCRTHANGHVPYGVQG